MQTSRALTTTHTADPLFCVSVKHTFICSFVDRRHWCQFIELVVGIFNFLLVPVDINTQMNKNACRRREIIVICSCLFFSLPPLYLFQIRMFRHVHNLFHTHSAGDLDDAQQSPPKRAHTRSRSRISPEFIRVRMCVMCARVLLFII